MLNLLSNNMYYLLWLYAVVCIVCISMFCIVYTYTLSLFICVLTHMFYTYINRINDISSINTGIDSMYGVSGGIQTGMLGVYIKEFSGINNDIPVPTV